MLQKVTLMWTRWAMLCGWLATGSVLALGIAASLSGPWPLWDAYALSFIDDQGRVIDRQGGDRTTSEGQSYGLFFALVANDHERFDRLLNWTNNNLAGGDLGTRLPGWLWGRRRAGNGRFSISTLPRMPTSGSHIPCAKPEGCGINRCTGRRAGACWPALRVRR